MKITESRIRQYIRQILTETIYGGVGGAPAQTRDQFEKQNPQIIATIPEDVPQIDRSWPARLALRAQEEYEDIRQNDPGTFDLLKQKLMPVAFGSAYNELLDNLTFTSADVNYINADINQSLSDKTNFDQMMLTLESFMPETAAYLQHIVLATDDFSRVPPAPESYTTLDPGEGKIFSDDLMPIFFSPPDNPDDIGMGESLIDYIIDKIISGMMQVKNMTPIEFADRFILEFESHINIHFQKNPIIANNAAALKSYRDAYLDSIKYVLRELIAELNFEFLYNGNGYNLTSTNPEDLLIFLPDDRSLLLKTAMAAKNIGSDGWGKFKDNLSDFYRPNSWARDEAPELRSMPSYYDIKFSFNPKFASIAGIEIKNNFHANLYDNLVFAVGFRKYNVDVDDPYDIVELWENS